MAKGLMGGGMIKAALTLGLALALAGWCLAGPAARAADSAPATPAAQDKGKAPAKGQAPAKDAAKDKPAEALKKLEDMSAKPTSTSADEGLAGLEPKPSDNPAPPPGAAGQFDPRIVQLIEQKRADLAVEESHLAHERQELEKLREEVGNRIDELKKVQGVLEDLVKAEQNQRAERVQQLVKVLSNMKPDAAGAVVAKLDDQMAVDVFSKMPPRTSGKVMATLPPEQAARIGELLTRQQQAREAAKLTGAAAAAGTQPPKQ